MTWENLSNHVLDPVSTPRTSQEPTEKLNILFNFIPAIVDNLSPVTFLETTLMCISSKIL